MSVESEPQPRINPRMKPHTLVTKFACFVFPALAAFLLGGCSGPPSESAGKQIVEKQIQSQSNGLIKLLSFRKTNAIDGGNAYRMEYEVEVEYLDEARVFQDPSLNGPFYAERGRVTSVLFMMEQRKKGENVKLSGSLGFEKTEKGWRGSDGAIY